MVPAADYADRIVSTAAATLVAAVLLCPLAAFGADDGDGLAGHGYVSLNYQYISVNGFKSSVGTSPIGPVETHTYSLDIHYHLNNRWTIAAGVPWVRKRYGGTFRHDPLALDPPRPWIENVDLGDWNTDFQDLHLGVKYLAKDGPLVIEPFIFYGVPTNDYPFFGHAAVGQQLWKIDVGSSFTYFPGLSNAYYRADIAYVFVEKTLGYSINHWKIFGEVGYQFGPRFTGRLFALLKDGDGLNFPEDFEPPPRTSEMWYQHDRLVKHNYLNVGVGLDWQVNEDYQLSANYMKQPWQEQVHKMEYAFTIGVTRNF